MKSVFIILYLSTIFSCNYQHEQDEAQAANNDFDVLLAYLEEGRNYINSNDMPSILNAAQVYNMLSNNILVIDIREKEEFDNGHIRNSVNIKPAGLLDYFENVIAPDGFETIVIVCNNGVVSSYVTGLMQLLGYENVHALGFGLSAWSREIAERHWLAALSSHLEDDMETIPNVIGPSAEKPVISTGEQMPYKILRARVSKLLAENIDEVFVDVQTFEQSREAFYVVTHRSQMLYDHSHLKGSFHYAPGSSLGSQGFLLSLPPHRPILTYCNRGHTSAFAAAYLRVLGYDARSLTYGAFSFTYNSMLELIPDRVYTERSIFDFPLEKTGEQSKPPQEGKTVPPVEIQGGC